jgi:hypothetical protein
MPASITAVATFSAVTTPLGSEARNAASFAATVQELANRDYYLQQICEVTGVPRIRAVSDVAALQALSLSGITDGDLRLVTGTEFFGVYRYVSASVAAAAQPWIIQPTVGSGRWIHTMNDAVAASNGLASLTGGGRLVQLPANALLFDGGYGVNSGLISSNSTTSYVDVASMTFAVGTVAAGDVVRVSLHSRMDNSGTTGTVRIVVTENGGAVIQVPGAVRSVATATDTLVTMVGRNVVATPGPLVVKVQILSGTAATPVSLQGPAAITYQVVRP